METETCVCPNRCDRCAEGERKRGGGREEGKRCSGEQGIGENGGKGMGK